MPFRPPHRWSALCGGVILLCSILSLQAAQVYSTSFEESEGYQVNENLVLQQGWIGTDTNGNGVIDGFFPGYGNQAYIGFSPLTPGQDLLYVWRPLNFYPLTSNLPLVTFSVLMEIYDSTTTRRDDFRWGVFNVEGDHLFTLDFENSSRAISYALNGPGSGFVFTDAYFTNNQMMRLELQMDFGSNQWSAFLDGKQITTNLPISQANFPLTLGDIDPVWVYRSGPTPGDNFMLFDNYSVIANPREEPPPLQPTLQLVERLSSGQTILRLFGQPNQRYALDVSSTLQTWTAVRTNSSSDGIMDFLDSTSSGIPHRFYRARVVP